MKNTMKAFYRPTEREFKEMWETATFVLDTNVLLNLYRYPIEARDELLAALEKIADRLWLPYHVALEYQRRRLEVIAEQKKRFSDVLTAIGNAKKGLENELNGLQLKKRHAVISVDDFLKGLGRLYADFETKLAALEKNEKDVWGYPLDSTTHKQ